MESELQRIHAKRNDARWRGRKATVERIVDSFRFSLPHLHDFAPSTPDICWIQEVRNTIVNGTDKEFQDREAEIRSRIPELSATWLEERRRFFLQLLPQNSPSPEHLFLAITLFDCMRCHSLGMRIEEATSPVCRLRYGDERKAELPIINSTNFFDNVGAPWDLGFAKYGYSTQLSAFVSEIVLECGENPDTVTTKEMNQKRYRYVCFDAGQINVLNWLQAVSPRAVFIC